MGQLSVEMEIDQVACSEGFENCRSGKFDHAKALEEITHLWSKATQKMVHVHGNIDFIAPADENIAFSKANIPEEFLDLRVVEDENHLILFFKSKWIRDLIMEFL